MIRTKAVSLFAKDTKRRNMEIHEGYIPLWDTRHTTELSEM